MLIRNAIPTETQTTQPHIIQKMIANSNKGFTLLETIIYIALFFIIIGGGMVGAYQIIQNTDRTASKTTLEQDANFIIRKIDWALTGAISASAVTPTHLFIDKAVNIDFTLAGTNFQKDGVTLNSLRIKISSLSFQNIIAPKAGIKTTFTATTSDGKTKQVFTNTKYLRK